LENVVRGGSLGGKSGNKINIGNSTSIEDEEWGKTGKTIQVWGRGLRGQTKNRVTIENGLQMSNEV